jgi:hypothetical protein
MYKSQERLRLASDLVKVSYIGKGLSYRIVIGIGKTIADYNNYGFYCRKDHRSYSIRSYYRTVHQYKKTTPYTMLLWKSICPITLLVEMTAGKDFTIEKLHHFTTPRAYRIRNFEHFGII